MLLDEINKLKKNLETLILENISNMTCQEVVTLSQELDVLIAEYFKNELKKS